MKVTDDGEGDHGRTFARAVWLLLRSRPRESVVRCFKKQQTPSQAVSGRHTLFHIDIPIKLWRKHAHALSLPLQLPTNPATEYRELLPAGLA
jgi:hypothetical protein